jgi:hypothetical protein
MYALGRECGVDDTISSPAKNDAACNVEAI